jgi:hypothetical protein
MPPARLARHLRESDPVLMLDGNDLMLYFRDDAKALQAFWLVHEVMGGEPFEQSPSKTPNPLHGVADSFTRPGRTEMSSADECMQSK